MPHRLEQTLALIADFYDECKYGVQGNEGFRKSTDLGKLTACIHELLSRGMLDPSRTRFLDLGCADGRVNVMMSFFVRHSIGIEIDPEVFNDGDKEMLEDLIVAALNEARQKAADIAKERMSGLTGGMNIPGLF